MSEMKVCPYCGNEILAVAKKCKFCKQWLPEENVVSDKNSNDDAQTNGGIQNNSIDTGNIKDDPYYDLFVEMNKEIQNKKAKKGLMIALCAIALVAVVGLVTMLVTKDSGTKNTIVSVQVGNQWGYIEKKTGAYVIKPQFDDAYSFAKNGLARVSQKGKWGYIDKTGQFVIKPQYDIAVDFTDYGLARVVIDNKLGCIDPRGKYVINPQPVLFFDFAKNGLAEAKLNDKWGYVDKTGKYVIEPQFDYAYGFADNGFALVKQKDKWGYIDNTGGFVIKPQFDVAHVFADNGIAIVKQNEKWGYIDKIGKFVITPQFDEAYGFADNGLAIVKQNDKWGYIDKTGKFVITPQFDKAYGFADNGLAIVKQNDKWGYIDKIGKIVITPQFDEAYGFADNGLARVEQKGKWGYIDKTGKYVINPQFDYALGFTDDGLAIVKQDHKYGIIDKTGKYVVKPQFDDIGHFKVKSNTDVAIDLANMWDSFHNLKNVDGFVSIYAPQVKYYQQTYTLKQIIKSKQDLFSKTPGFQQSVSNFKVTNNTDGSVIVYFDKRVWSSAKKNPETYPSYLVVKKINGNWLIIEESDEITDENLAKKNANRQGKKPFITGLSQYKLYGATGGSYVYDGNGKKLNVTLSLNKYYMNCVISDGKGNNDNIPFKFDYKIDFSSRKNEYAIGRHDFDGDNIDEIVIGMFSPNDKDGDFAAVVVYRVLDRKKWDFHFAYRVNGVRIIVTNNEINVPWVPEYGMGFDMDCGYAFENGDFVNTELEEEYEEYEYE